VDVLTVQLKWEAAHRAIREALKATYDYGTGRGNETAPVPAWVSYMTYHSEESKELFKMALTEPLDLLQD